MKDIEGYEGLYAITEDGKVWSYRSQIYLTPKKSTNKYLNVKLCNNGKEKTFMIHRLVAEAYIPNPNNLPVVNHKDENKYNNCVDNLEWATHQYNVEYSHGMSVYCVELDKIFKTLTSAGDELSISKSSICSCCKGKLKTAGGYHWRYVDEQ